VVFIGFGFFVCLLIGGFAKDFDVADIIMFVLYDKDRE
jgi:hypothetical protein